MGCHSREQIQTYTVPKEPKAVAVADATDVKPGEPTDRMLAAILPAGGEAWFFKAVGQIPIRREGGSASEGALLAAADVLQSGGVFGIYPEGTRTRDGNLHRGHTGVAVNAGARWLLHCGDAYFNHAQVATPPSCPPLLGVFQRLLASDNAARVANTERLRELAAAHGDEVQLFSAHDRHELERFQAANTAAGSAT
jgi:hypothetical protein